jgi:transcriptional regulator with XRE-family HTH domain
MPLVKGREIRERRQQRGIKLAEFAALTRIAYKTTANIESKSSQLVAIEVVYRMAAVLECDARDLLADPDRIAA